MSKTPEVVIRDIKFSISGVYIVIESSSRPGEAVAIVLPIVMNEEIVISRVKQAFSTLRAFGGKKK